MHKLYFWLFYIYTVFHKKLDPLLFYHIFALAATNCMNIFYKYTGGVACCEYERNVCVSLTILC